MPATATDRLYGLTTSVALKPPCRVATTANITLSGLQTIDGVTVVADDRVLVKDQTNSVDNGIYKAGTSAWSRAPDFDGTRDAVNGTLVIVRDGITNKRSVWKLTTADPVAIATDNLTFEKALLLDSATAVFLQAGTGAVDRTAQDKMRDVVSVKDFGAVGDGASHPLSGYFGTLAAAQAIYPHALALTDEIDGIAIKAALATGKSVFVPDGTFLISAPLPVNQQTLQGAGWRRTFINTTSAIAMATLASSGVVRDMQLSGGNVATKGITVPDVANRISAYCVRVEKCARGIELLNTQNSLLQECYVQYCDANYYFDGIENCKVINCNGNLDNAGRTVTAAARNVVVTNALYGTVRGLTVNGGIFERGSQINDYCVEITGAYCTFIGVEFNGGGLAAVRQNAAAYCQYDSPAFTLSGQAAISCDSAAIWDIKGNTYVSGAGGRSLTSGLVVGGVSAPFELAESRFDYSAVALVPNGDIGSVWGASSGGAMAYNAADRCLDVTTGGAVQGVRLSYATTAPLDPNTYAGRYYDLEIILSDISTANPCAVYATMPGSPFRRLLGTAGNGLTRLTVPADIGDLFGFEVTANEAVAKTFKLRYFKARLI